MLLIVLTLVFAAEARISVMYAHEKMTDRVAEQCLVEMYPKAKQTLFQDTDEPCIIFCVLKKFGIMNNNGGINLEIYNRRIRTAHNLEVDNHLPFHDRGSTCMETADATQHKQDVCRKAKVFNDCTRLYKLMFKEE